MSRPTSGRTLLAEASRLTREVRDAASQLRLARGTARESLAEGLVLLSNERRDALGTLVGGHPGQAARLVLPPSIRRTLHALPGAWAESRVTVTGRYRLQSLEGNPATILNQLVTDDGRKVFTVRGGGRLPGLRTDEAISVSGYRVGDQLLAPRGGLKRAGAGQRLLASSTSATTVGAMKTAVLLANFSDNASAADLAPIIATFQGSPGRDVLSYFSEASYGKMSVAPSFYGPYTLSTSSATGCSSNPQQALMSAAAADLDFTQFSRLVFVYNCPNSNFGSATSVGPVSTPQGAVQAAQIALDIRSASDLYSVVHELSHTLGSFNMHAAFYVCLPDSFVAPARFEAACVSSEYGDRFDVLGGGGEHRISQLNPSHKANAGWFDAGQFPTISTGGTSTYTLAPYEQATGGVLALNIPRGQSGTAFTVEYRQPVGFDAWMASASLCPACTATRGASIRFAAGMGGSGGGSDTQLLDMTPGTIPSTSYYPTEDGLDGALLPGRTFTDPEYGIAITAVSTTASGLVVQVTIPPQTCVRGTPTVTTPSPSTQSAAVGQTGTYTVTLTNTDSAGCAPNSFRYFPPSNANVQVVASPDQLSLAPGASASISLKASALPLTIAGSYGFFSSDGTGAGILRSNSNGTGDAIVSGLTFQLTSPPDTTAPVAPTGLTADALGSSVARIAWLPATDNVGVIGYKVTRSGANFTTGTTSLLDTSVAAGAGYTYSVQAFDRNGNVGSAATVTLTTPARTDVTRPTAPTVSATAGDHSLSVSWTAGTDNVGVAYYRIYPCLVPRCVVPASVRSFTVEGLPTRTQYDIQVVSVDADGTMSDFAYGTYTVYTAASGTSAPSQPKRLFSGAGTYSHVELSWAPSTDDGGVAGYDVYRNNRRIATVTGTSFTDASVGSASEYYVQAVDGAGSLSAPSMRVWFPAPSSASADSAPPTASITAPFDAAAVSDAITISALASDNEGVSRVELFVDGKLLVTKTSAPYSFTWDTTTVSNGTHWLYARAYDAAGNYGTAGTTTVSVANAGSADEIPPTVSITAPANGSTVAGLVTISAAASDNVGVTKVDLLVDGVVVASDASAPYGATWDASSAAAGTHTVAAVAHDAAGNTQGASVSVTRPAPGDTTPPTVSFTAPANGASVSGTVQVLVAATDDVAVAKIELSVDGTLKSALTAAPWSFGLDTSTLAPGNHTLGVKAYDAAGNSASAQLSVTVAAILLPAPDTTLPSAPASVRALILGTTQIALSWAASKDNVGVVAYDVYRDGVLIGEAAATNYLDSGLAPATSHGYRVVARDLAGNLSIASSLVTAKTVATSTSTTGTLSGVVLDQLGKPLANAIVQITVNGALKSAKTSSSGVWKLRSVPGGIYTVTVTLAGYQVTTTTAAATNGQVVLLSTVLLK